MALCPFAVKKLIPPGVNDPRIKPRIAILHVDAGDSPSLFEFFRDRSGGIESHFHIPKVGPIEQYRDTDWQADANHLANDFAVAIETQGLAAEAWNPHQIENIKRLLVWLNEVHPAIALRKVDKWDGTGIGYHIQFGTPGKWTPVAKSCPGALRIIQYNEVIVPWLNKGALLLSEEEMLLWGFSWNTHVGQQLFNGGVRWALNQRKYDFVCLQEVQSPKARRKLRRVFNPLIWSSVGTRPESDSRGASGTMIMARRKRLKKISGSNNLISKFHDTMHPERRATRGLYRDKVTDNIIDIGCVHAWFMGSDLFVREEHNRQINTYAATARLGIVSGRITLRVGDWNEKIAGIGDTQAEQAMLKAGLRLVGRHLRPRIDALFVGNARVKDFNRTFAPEEFNPEGSHLVISFAIKPD